MICTIQLSRVRAGAVRTSHRTPRPLSRPPLYRTAHRAVRGGTPAPTLRRRGVPTASRSSDDEGQEPEIARALDCLRELALLLRRDRGDPARHDLAALRYVALQQLDVL